MAEEAARAAAEAPPAPDPGAARRATASMLTYRLIPLWVFLVTFGVTVVWQAGAQGGALTTEKLQAAALLALIVAILLGAPIGIRFFNPQPPKT